MPTRPVSVRLREVLPNTQLAESLADEVQRVETLALARSVNSCANGKHPWHWSLERWLAVFSFTGIVLGLIWMAGGEWRDVQQAVANLTTRLDALAGQLAAHLSAGGLP